MIDIKANPDIGERGDFIKITITLPPEMLEALKVLGVRRKASKQKDTNVSALIREAVADLMEREGL